MCVYLKLTMRQVIAIRRTLKPSMMAMTTLFDLSVGDC